MNRLDKQDLRQQITEEIADQKILIQRLTETSKPVSPDNAIGRLTRMEAISSRGVSETSLLTAKNKLAKLENALDKVDLPEFGICVNCGLAIPAGRIRLLPEVEICVSCAEKNHPDTSENLPLHFHDPIDHETTETFSDLFLILSVLSLTACSKEKPGTPLNLPPAEEPSARLFNDFGIDFFEKGNYFDASLNFNQAIVADHTSGEVHYNMALALYMRGEEERAVKELQLAKQYADGNPEILNSPFLKRYVK